MATDYFALIDINLAAECNKKLRLDYFTPPPKCTFRIETTLDAELLDKLEDDVEFQGEIQKLRTKLLTSARKRYSDTLTEADKAADKLKDKTAANLERLAARAGKELESELDLLEGISETEVDKIVTKWLKDRAERKSYVIKCARKLVSSAVGVVTSSIGVASAVTGNLLGLIAGVYGLVKSIASLGKEIYKLAIDIDKAEADLKATLDKVAKNAAKDSKVKLAAKEVAAAMAEKLFVFKPASIKSCEGDLELYIGKLRGVQVKLSDFSKQLTKMLDAQTAIKKVIRDKIMKELNDAGYNSKRLPGLLKDLDKLEKETDKQISAIEKMYQRIEIGKRNEKIYRDAVDDMADLKPSWFGKFEKALIAVDIALAFAGGDLDADGWATLAVDTANEVKEWVAEELEA